MSEIEDEFLDYDIKTDLENLKQLLNLDRLKIESVISAFNKDGANVNYNKLAELTGFQLGIDVVASREALATLVHFYNTHREPLDRTLTKTEVDKKVIRKLYNVLNKLNKKGVEGLELIFAGIKNEERPTLLNLEGKLLLTEILDDNNKGLGYLPLVRLNFDFLDQDESQKNQSFFIQLENLGILVETLKNIEFEAIRSLRKYHEKLGESILVSGGK
jgi:hypothetical protein